MSDAVEIRRQVGELQKVIIQKTSATTNSIIEFDDVERRTKDWINSYLQAVCDQLIASAAFAWATHRLVPEEATIEHLLGAKFERAVEFVDLTGDELDSTVQEYLGAMWHHGEVAATVQSMGIDEDLGISARFTAR